MSLHLGLNEQFENMILLIKFKVGKKVSTWDILVNPARCFFGKLAQEFSAEMHCVCGWKDTFTYITLYRFKNAYLILALPGISSHVRVELKGQTLFCLVKLKNRSYKSDLHFSVYLWYRVPYWKKNWKIRWRARINFCRSNQSCWRGFFGKKIDLKKKIITLLQTPA